MYYLADRGPVIPASQRIGLAAGLVLPALFISILVLGFFSYNSLTGSGKNPYISPPKHQHQQSSVAPAPASGSSSTGTVSAPATSSGQAPTAYITSGQAQPVPAPTSLSTQSINGGLGGGTSSVAPSSTTSSTSAATSGSSGSGLLPATVTAPSTNLQAGGKTILTTSPMTVTVN